jgi:hypothetical protein
MYVIQRPAVQNTNTAFSESATIPNHGKEKCGALGRRGLAVRRGRAHTLGGSCQHMRGQVGEAAETRAHNKRTQRGQAQHGAVEALVARTRLRR